MGEVEGRRRDEVEAEEEAVEVEEEEVVKLQV